MHSPGFRLASVYTTRQVFMALSLQVHQWVGGGDVGALAGGFVVGVMGGVRGCRCTQRLQALGSIPGK